MTSSVQAAPDSQPGLLTRLSAEALGSLFVVLVAAGVSIFSNPSGAPLPAALATGLTVTVAMLAFGHTSGGHFNPVVTLGNLIAGRIRPVAAVAYIAAQVIGSVVGAALVYIVVTMVPVLTDARAAFGSAAAGFGEHAVAQTQMAGVLLVEVVGSALLVAVFLGATAGRRAVPSMAPFAVGLTVAVLLQFGPGAAGGPHGRYLLGLTDELSRQHLPYLVTLHGIHPTAVDRLLTSPATGRGRWPSSIATAEQIAGLVGLITGWSPHAAQQPARRRLGTLVPASRPASRRLDSISDGPDWTVAS